MRKPHFETTRPKIMQEIWNETVLQDNDEEL